MKERLRTCVNSALKRCYAEGSLNSGEYPHFVVEIPAHSEHGDFAVNIALALARAEKQAPRKIAEILVAALDGGDGLWDRLDIAGPGFINFHLAQNCWYAVLDEIMSQGERYGCSEVGGGAKVQIEFVSANPTGPLHIGHGRGAATGDAAARMLAAAGYDVQREYYINDAGNQVVILGRSIWMRLRELCGVTIEFPEDGYHGDYIRDIAVKLRAAQGDAPLRLAETEAIEVCGRFGMEYVITWIERDLQAFGVRFDNWYSEKSLYDRDLVQTELNTLRDKGLTFEQDGALWFRTTAYGDDKDRVLIRSDGIPTYFASDVAYHMEKFERGFSRVIDVWGADHHGYVPRMKAVLEGLGHEPDDLRVLLIQMVNLLRDGQPVAMGKRSGEFVTLRDVIDEVGSDACRYFFLMRRSDSPLDFDLELAKQQSNDNPVYYVQYAHARVCSINRTAAELGMTVPTAAQVDFTALQLPEELSLAKLLARFPETVAGAAENLEPHRVVYYLQELGTLFHSYYNKCRIIGDDPTTSHARLYLVNSVRIVLANALGLLGVSAPERM
ncbi:MAG: arginine--tRNA ligase [Desulfuromonadales bacterium]|nr:arginine--tRNA ligase [Desulfuromonadales bacterium]MDT8423599.1 arginine--tRNA ligase [Desulfuromonadales bacterium]